MLTGQLLLQGKAPEGPGASANILPCLPCSGNFSLQWDPALHGRRARCGQSQGPPRASHPSLESQHCPLYSLLGGTVGHGTVGQSLILRAELLLETSPSLERKQGPEAL